MDAGAKSYGVLVWFPSGASSSKGDRFRTHDRWLRVISRTPSFAVAVVCVLALGIGANTAIFSIVNAVLLRLMPFEEMERLVRLFTLTSAGAGVWPEALRQTIATATIVAANIFAVMAGAAIYTPALRYLKGEAYGEGR